MRRFWSELSDIRDGTNTDGRPVEFLHARVGIRYPNPNAKTIMTQQALATCHSWW